MIEYIKLTRHNISEINYLVENLRQADYEEILAAGHSNIYLNIYMSVDNSICYAAKADETLRCIFGVTKPMPDGARVVWLLGTDTLDKHTRIFFFLFKFIADNWIKKYGTLFNHVHGKNKKSLRWLRYLGAKFYAPITASTGEEFILFTLGGADNV